MPAPGSTSAGDDGYDPSDYPGFKCKADNVRLMVSLLSGIHSGRKDQICQAVVSKTGLRVSVENPAKNMHAAAYLDTKVWQEWEIRLIADPRRGHRGRSGRGGRGGDDSPRSGDSGADGGHDDDEDYDDDNAAPMSVRFRVNLHALIDCLTVYGSSCLTTTSLHASYDTGSCAFHLLLEHGGVLTECTMRTVDAGDELDFTSQFRSTDVLSKLLVRSDNLREAFMEIGDTPGAVSVSVFVAPDVDAVAGRVAGGGDAEGKRMRLTTEGSAATCAVEFNGRSEAFLSFECARQQECTYSMGLIQQATKALPHAAETYLRINAAGMLSMSHKLFSEEGVPTFVQFIILADTDDGADSDDDDAGDGDGARAGESGGDDSSSGGGGGSVGERDDYASDTT